MADAIEGQGVPAPWPWQYCRYCMDLQSGTFLNWPMGPTLKENLPVLEMMKITWDTWRHISLTSRAKHKWTEQDIHFDDWLNQDRPQLLAAPSALEVWAAEQGYIDE
ncbi:MAG: hypothetical protein KC419_08150 [Anaerolineales bacterium]|nr:hypothetical protein [Anaerolineales bacterium]MCA9928433.1 hypothetical protein [Anaerolineales bacterium]